MEIAVFLPPPVEPRTGIKRYAYSLLGALLRLDPSLRARLLGWTVWGKHALDDNIRSMEALGIPIDRVSVESLRFPSRLERSFWGRRILRTAWSLRIRRHPPRLLLVFDPIGFFGDFPTILTFYDFMALERPDLTEPGTCRLHNRHFADHARRAARILVISKDVQSRAERLLSFPSSRIHLAKPGVSSAFLNLPDEAREAAMLKPLNLPGKYFLMVGNLDPRKNVPAVLNALAKGSEALRPLSLVLAGPSSWNPVPTRKIVDALGLAERVRFLGFVPDTVLPALYRRAESFLFPSLYEGFGIPIVEAMACGTPVVTSNKPPMDEAAGDAALLVDPEDPKALEAAMSRIVTDEALRRELSDRGRQHAKACTWEAAAVETRRAIAESLATQRKPC